MNNFTMNVNDAAQWHMKPDAVKGACPTCGWPSWGVGLHRWTGCDGNQNNIFQTAFKSYYGLIPAEQAAVQ